MDMDLITAIGLICDSLGSNIGPHDAAQLVWDHLTPDGVERDFANNELTMGEAEAFLVVINAAPDDVADALEEISCTLRRP